MITTRFGSEVQILQKPDFGGFVTVRRVADGAIRDWHLSKLKADSPQEMHDAIEHAGPSHEGNTRSMR